MKILVIKLTSMGDVIHTLPALSDLHTHTPHKVDFLVEDSFADIPAWHPSVNRVFCISTRGWRRPTVNNIKAIIKAYKLIRGNDYDLVIDAQGLMKSAVIGFFVRLTPQGKRAGFCAQSIKESPAAWLYHKKITVAEKQHAITRLRDLFAQIFSYQPDYQQLEYGIANKFKSKKLAQSVLFLHGTTWPSKHLPETLWLELGKIANANNYKVYLTWGNQQEQQRAKTLAEQLTNVEILDKMSLNQLARNMSACNAAIAVDTGLAHLAAALDLPCLSLYGSTNAKLTGTKGISHTQLQANYPCSPCLKKQCAFNTQNQPMEIFTPPCYKTFSAQQIWHSFTNSIG